MDLENPLNQKFFEEDNFDTILQSLKILGLKTSEKGFVFIDEIQFMRKIPGIVKYLMDFMSSFI